MNYTIRVTGDTTSRDLEGLTRAFVHSLDGVARATLTTDAGTVDLGAVQPEASQPQPKRAKQPKRTKAKKR